MWFYPEVLQNCPNKIFQSLFPLCWEDCGRTADSNSGGMSVFHSLSTVGIQLRENIGFRSRPEQDFPKYVFPYVGQTLVQLRNPTVGGRRIPLLDQQLFSNKMSTNLRPTSVLQRFPTLESAQFPLLGRHMLAGWDGYNNYTFYFLPAHMAETIQKPQATQ